MMFEAKAVIMQRQWRLETLWNSSNRKLSRCILTSETYTLADQDGSCILWCCLGLSHGAMVPVLLKFGRSPPFIQGEGVNDNKTFQGAGAKEFALENVAIYQRELTRGYGPLRCRFSGVHLRLVVPAAAS